MTLKVTKFSFEYLKQNPEKKFTAREIADWIFQTYPSECQEKKDKSPRINTDAELLNQIASQISKSSFQNHPEIRYAEERPQKYYFSKFTDGSEIAHAESYQNFPASKTKGTIANEHDLYPILSQFLWSELALYSKRIDEKRSRNSRGSGGNEWLYPDLVGLENLTQDWEHVIKECAKEHKDKETKLWSFEVKKLINRSNVRKVFFQAVSNSSWANFGYLVSSQIEGKDTLKELRMLASLHGIGFIRLDVKNPLASQIIIPAKERSQIDWDTANRLAQENKDFLEYIKRIRNFYRTGEIRHSDWNADRG